MSILRYSAEHFGQIARIDMQFDKLLKEARTVFAQNHQAVDVDESSAWKELAASIEERHQKALGGLRASLVDPA